MKRVLLFSIFAMLVICLNAQTWSEIKSQKNVYLCGEGRGETIEEADEQALVDLISQISIAVEKQFTMTEEETVSNKGAETSSYAKSKVRSYSSATLTNTERLIVQDEPEAVVGRYIKRSELDKIFKGRRDKVREYVGLALAAEQNMALDNSLRYLYWSSSLLKTLPHPDEVKYKTDDGIDHTLSNWIPAKMDDILGGIKVNVIGKEGNDVDLFFSYKGRPVSSLDYRYFDGRDMSSIYSAKDGRGVLELLPGTTPENIKLRYEYQYKDQAKLYDKEVASVVGVVKGGVRKKATCNIGVDWNKATAAPANGMSAGQTSAAAASQGTGSGVVIDGEMVFRVNVPQVGNVPQERKSACKNVVDQIVKAIQNKNYSSVKGNFTDYGYEIFLKLMQYGNARVLQQREYTYSNMNDQTVVRSVPMSFNFKQGAVKSFVEDVVFTVNADGKVDNISFGLGDVATADIMAKTMWIESVKCMIVNFLEVYKTAFALKRLDYIESIFDDNAVIITGRVLMKKSDGDADRYASNRYVQRTRYTKAEYMDHLRASFGSKEYINIRFAHTMVQKAQGKEIYGIQLKQDYYSSNYGDSGYLYLQVDMTDPSQPVIKVRTWQDQIDPEVGRPYGMEDF